jgi:hypothetical protein
MRLPFARGLSCGGGGAGCVVSWASSRLRNALPVAEGALGETPRLAADEAPVKKSLAPNVIARILGVRRRRLVDLKPSGIPAPRREFGLPQALGARDSTDGDYRDPARKLAIFEQEGIGTGIIAKWVRGHLICKDRGRTGRRVTGRAWDSGHRVRRAHRV